MTLKIVNKKLSHSDTENHQRKLIHVNHRQRKLCYSDVKNHQRKLSHSNTENHQ
jgi:hypothetical protein